MRRIGFLALTATLLQTVPALAAVPGSAPRLVAGGGDTAAGYLIAGNEGARFTLPGDGVVQFAPGTQARVLKRPQRVHFSPTEVATTYSVLLKSGLLHVDLPTAKDDLAVVVATLHGTAAIVQSGQVVVATNGNDVIVANLDGQVQSHNEAGRKSVPQGMAHEFAGANADPTLRALVLAPHFKASNTLFASLHAPTPLTGVEWEPITDSAEYEVTLEREPDRVVIGRARLQRAELTGELQATPGLYRLQVRAIDAQGIPGRPSEALPIRVVGVALPEGASIDTNGTILLAREQRVSLTHAEGLLLTHQGTSQPGTEAFGLREDQPTVMMLRYPDTLRLVPLRLEPRPYQAEVEVLPKTARWPTDPIQVRVRLNDGKGGPPPSWLNAIPTVSLGVDPLEVDWEQTRHELRTVVEPQACERYCVVRVEIHDQYGYPLGRDFVEIVSELTPPPAAIPEPGMTALPKLTALHKQH